MNIQLNSRDIQETSILDASGKLTLGAGTFGIRQKVLELLAAGRKQIVLNLDRVSFMDSSAIGEMVEAHSTAVSLGGTMKLVSSRRRVHDLLSVAKLHLVFEIFEDETDALISFGNPPSNPRPREQHTGAFAG